MTETTKNFIVYKASAGSGKTYTLVKEYLKLTLANPSKYRHILAVTFTNKAAYEMKSRIIATLKKISDLNDALMDSREKEKLRSKIADLTKDLSAVSGLDEHELAARADVLLQRILHNYSDFAISTIDSFVQRIIRTFAYDLKLSQNFEVELDSSRVLAEAVDVILSYAGTDEEVTRMLIGFVKQKLEDGQNWDIEKDLKTFAEQLLKEDTQKYISLFGPLTMNDFSRCIGNTVARRKKLNSDAVKLASDVVKLIDSNHIDPKSFFQGQRGIPAFFRKVTEYGLTAAVANSYVLKAVEEDIWYGKATPDGDKEKIDGIKTLIAEAFNAIQPMRTEYLDLTIIMKSLYPLSLLSQIEKETENIKAEENIIFISDFYRKIHEQLLNEPVPFIYQRTGEKFEHYFIDEFQDTSVLQFQNMLPLIENAMASGNPSLIVGDGKQAIYRWRNGEVMQFASLPAVYRKPSLKHFDDIEKALSRNIITYDEYDKDIQNINYRSRSEIIAFNNGLFGYLAAKILTDDKKRIYEHHEQRAKSGNEGGYVRIRFFESGSDYTDNQKEYVLEIISDLQKQGRAQKDIAVICRQNKQAAGIASFLLHNGIDVVSNESLLLGSSPKVNFLISVLRCMTNPDDELAAAFILYFLQQSYDREISFNELMELYRSGQQETQQGYAMNRIMEYFSISIDFAEITLIPLYDLSEYLVRIFGFNVTPDPFIIYFLDAVSEFAGSNTPGVQDFLEWWDEKGALKSIVVPDKLNAVKVLTIHKAKGLEFPVVIYPFADEAASTKGASVWMENMFDFCPGIPAFHIPVSKSGLEGSSFEACYRQEKSDAWLDMLNICYVALTRPEEQLYILTRKYDKADGGSFGAWLKKYLTDTDRWSDDTDTYEYGDIAPGKVKGDENEKSRTVIPENIISANWKEKMIIRYHSSLLWKDEDIARSIRWGNIVHKVLSEIRLPSDAAGAVAKLVAEGVVTAEDGRMINSSIEELLNNEEIGMFFVPGLNVLTEKEILTPDNELYRPDRIVIGDSKNIVIDFKTGAAREDDKTQVRNYARLLTGINGKPCELYLVYLQKELRIERVDS